MISNKINNRVTSHLRALSFWDFKATFVLTILAAIVSSLFATYYRGYINGQEDFDALFRASCPSWTWASGTSFSHILSVFRLSIAGALVITGIGLWSRKAVGLYLSVLALACVIGIYTWWYFASLAFLEMMEIPDFLQSDKHIGKFRGAVWWDMVALTVTVILFLWQAKTLVKALMLSSNESMSKSTFE